MRTGWALRSYLELAALPGAVPCARLHAKQVLREWGLKNLAETVELVVSEIVTNAVRASGGLDSDRRSRTPASGIPTVRLWLYVDKQQILVQVWDGNQRRPEPRRPGLEAENGRGLLLVEALSREWGSFVPNGWRGKVVWAVVEGP